MLKTFLEYLSKEYPSAASLYDGDKLTLILSVAGAIEISFFFIVLGLTCLFFLDSTMPKEAYKERKRIMMFFGLSLLSCGISRAFDVIAIWHNYAFINAVFRNLTGLMSVAAIAYLPIVMKAIKNSRTLEQVHQSMEKTSEKIDKLKDITERVIDGTK